ncbi:CHAT domain-containing protein [Sphingomonas alba]|uniref:CHAT domain-containing protein n=1 Tax=Sphingomonas alba TaxID=2908208 RepID=A0ABT0RMR6_9SPHN|nr:CHAT domain-containing protein [Sphingomonas alba]MCL6683941.1 CHAT domain-containing protein [Sphingomonas alba]
MTRVFGHSLRLALLASSLLAASAASGKAEQPLSTMNGFRLGDAGVLCTAQIRSADRRLTGVFDRAYVLTCRDAASAVGSVIAVRRAIDLANEQSIIKTGALTCTAPAAATVENVGNVTGVNCRDDVSKLDYKRYTASRGRTNYMVEGLAGYDPALRLALASVVTDRMQQGSIQVATTEVSDAAAFARTQAGAFDPSAARTEAYARNNGGRFAESAEFFENLADREGNDAASRAEALANQGLQQSNLANFAAAERLLSAAERASPKGNGVIQRLLRNYRAINELNQHDANGALAALKTAVADVIDSDDQDSLRGGLITLPLADEINKDANTAAQVTGLGNELRPAERAAVLDAQALQLAGIAARMQGRLADASNLLSQARGKLQQVREGKLQSAAWLSAEIDVERALVAEASGDHGSTIGAFDTAIGILQQNFPQSPMLLATKARKAGYLARSGDEAGARTLYAEVVDQSSTIPDSGTALRELLAPYFGLLSRDGSADAAANMFRASQALQRPGVAQTQAVLARQMSEGNDEASTMFRLAVARTREIVRTEADIARLSTKPAPTARDLTNLAQAKASLDSMKADQTQLQAKLADYPRYKVLAPQQTELAEVRAALRPGEGYYKMMVIGDRMYAIYATHDTARAYRLDPTKRQMADDVAKIRDSIVYFQGDKAITDPFDAVRARKLYLQLFGPVDAEVQGLKHLVFEPDGPMLQLPPYLLITKQASLDAYEARIRDPNADPFDMRGIDWLGRGREVSISVGPRAFLDMRAIAPSHARRAYLGLGTNTPVWSRPVAAVADECDWPLVTWERPISSAELAIGQNAFGANNSAVITGDAFTDTALLSDNDLDNYRILHFATHGLVTAPRPDCPPRPALVTSFGGSGSDGLLSFREIFDLKLDADVVILSACDTAGAATSTASREAGIATGGNYALDGLVRAFVGAGARSVVASHWPVPDDYDATKRLISGMIEAKPGQPLGQALERAQEGLMDDARTSHPFYWAAFIILGDASKPLVPTSSVAAK